MPPVFRTRTLVPELRGDQASDEQGTKRWQLLLNIQGFEQVKTHQNDYSRLSHSTQSRGPTPLTPGTTSDMGEKVKKQAPDPITNEHDDTDLGNPDCNNKVDVPGSNRIATAELGVNNYEKRITAQDKDENKFRRVEDTIPSQQNNLEEKLRRINSDLTSVQNPVIGHQCQATRLDEKLHELKTSLDELKRTQQTQESQMRALAQGVLTNNERVALLEHQVSTLEQNTRIFREYLIVNDLIEEKRVDAEFMVSLAGLGVAIIGESAG
jgi:archaellum component FlaC